MTYDCMWFSYRQKLGVNVIPIKSVIQAKIPIRPRHIQSNYFGYPFTANKYPNPGVHWQQELANVHYGNKSIFHVSMRKSIHLYHSKVLDNTGRHGVVIAISEAAQAALLAWVPISPRLASVPLPTKHHHGSPLVMPVQPAPGECRLN